MLQASVHSKIRQASRGSYDDPPANPAFYVEPIGVAQVHGYVWYCHCIIERYVVRGCGNST
jgi:hypothetical protein